jgi:pimeloyl-ACP methyl ester carboxylesterase
MIDSGKPVRLLVGHSFGGSAVIDAAHAVPDARAVVSIGAPYEPAHVEHNYDALIERILADGEAAFQEVFHLHLHVFPRTAGDAFGLVADWRVRPRDELDGVAARVRAGLIG